MVYTVRLTFFFSWGGAVWVEDGFDEYLGVLHY